MTNDELGLGPAADLEQVALDDFEVARGSRDGSGAVIVAEFVVSQDDGEGATATLQGLRREVEVGVEQSARVCRPEFVEVL